MTLTVTKLKYKIQLLEEQVALSKNQQAELAELHEALGTLREKNRNKGHWSKTPAHREGVQNRRLDAINKKIAKKEKTIAYFTAIRDTNPTYFDHLVADMEFDLKVLLNQRDLI